LTATELQPRVSAVALSSDQETWLDQAWGTVDRDEIAELLLALTSISSPTGEERAIAEFLVGYLRRAGLEGIYQAIDDQQGNAIGRLTGDSSGADLLLYAPTDTAFSGEPAEEVPWIGESIRADLLPQGFRVDDYVVGLGAENPKAYVACVVSAAMAIRRAGVPLKGSLLVGLGAGGMPTNQRPGQTRANAGQGNGCSFMLEQGFRGDFAILAKPGDAVAWEEVGVCWFRVRVHGRLGYTGIRHVVPYKNPIVDAASVIAGLEDWFPRYSARHTSGLVSPQGSIGAIRGGWPHKPAFVPAATDLYVDIRVSPRSNPLEVKRELGEALADIQARQPGLELEHEMILSIPGTHTDPRNWIVQSLMRAWERREGRPQTPITGTSGATDAAILRGRGIPTARLGLPRTPPLPDYPGFSMGATTTDAMSRLVQCLIYAIVDTCTRDRSEVGLR
jgi:acetylornithine deacetylase/succinyl-diaminopimelate desuccinylase-like protein